MCLFANEVDDVANTQIYVAADINQTEQCVIYEMAVSLRGGVNAMILPVPAEAGSIKLYDLSTAEDLFKELNEMFVVRSRGMSFGKEDDEDSLEVVQVGNYDVSVAPSVADMKRVNRGVFQLSANVEETLRKHYASGFAFVVAQLRESGKGHPLAYTHPLADKRLFIPTRHEHGPSTQLPKWDHHIFYPYKLGLEDFPANRYNQAPPAQYLALSPTSVLEMLAASEATAPLCQFFLRKGMQRTKLSGRMTNMDLSVRL